MIEVTDRSVTFVGLNGKQVVIVRSEAPLLLKQHSEEWKGAKDLEILGRAVAVHPSPDWEGYVKGVYDWGRGHRNLARVLEQNDDKSLSAVFSDVCRLTGQGAYEDAVKKVTELKQVGVAFGSKLVAFLARGNAVVYDSWIVKGLGHIGYDQFLNDCRAAKRPLGLASEVEVERVVFTKIRNSAT